jgi:mannose-6-phosphate isomerase-like protein (cupin superfamily)
MECVLRRAARVSERRPAGLPEHRSRVRRRDLLCEIPSGVAFELHWHSHAEYAVVLRGKVTHTLGTQSVSLTAGDYVIIPAKTNHAWQVEASGDAFLLMRRDGPADFNFVER